MPIYPNLRRAIVLLRPRSRWTPRDLKSLHVKASKKEFDRGSLECPVMPAPAPRPNVTKPDRSVFAARKLAKSAIIVFPRGKANPQRHLETHQT